jgi:hypothetical protein
MATNWKRKPQECDGDYHFAGLFVYTSGVQAKIPPEEVDEIYQEIKDLVKQENGIDYLQVFENGKGEKLFFIDSMAKSVMEANGIDPNDHVYNHCTLMFDYEY